MKKFIIIIALLFSLTTSLHSQWIKQNWPVFESIYGVSFFDANTGLVAMKTYPGGYYAIYRTTNRGFNWVENYRPLGWIYQSQKINDSTVYVLGDDRTNYYIYRSYNRGISWDSVQYPSIDGLYFINKDTGWAAMFNGNSMGYYRTDDGANTFNLLSSIPASNSFDVKLFFLKQKYNGNYIGFRSFNGAVKKTTDGGYTWIDLPGLPGANDTYLPNGKKLINEIGQITFLNKDTGWVTNNTKNIFKTTNGGYNWTSQPIPSETHLTPAFTNFMGFQIINKDTLYASGGNYSYGNNIFRGVIFKTTNGGMNWGYQLPDTSFREFLYIIGDFINGQTGWSNNLHTTNGGGPIIYTEIKNITVEHPEEYKLMQNYPNPFNSSTIIKFNLPRHSIVSLKIYDISGKEEYRIIDNFILENGYHSYRIASFETLGLSSGVYFYNLQTKDIKQDKILFNQTKKLIYLK